MPELPEVETVKEILKKQVVNRTIGSVEVLYAKTIDGDENEFVRRLSNQTIRDIKRKGKFLIFCFDDFFMLSHLRMEGKYFIKDNNEPVIKHEHIIFHLDSGEDLRYHDTRKFGMMKIVENLDCDPLNKLGFEPWELTVSYLKDKFSKKKPIKELLLDQSIIAGLGNIYADEVCYYARIMPTLMANQLTEKQINSIIEGSKYILQEAIIAGGTTIRSYTSSLGVTGRFQQQLKVHAQEKCMGCGGLVKKIVVGGRGTYYCPFCQKDKIVIGITGGIASGKSTITMLLKEYGYHVIDADIINSSLLKEDYVINEIGQTFGVVKDGQVDRKELANIVFNDEKERIKLNNILHPLVINKIQEKITERLNFVDVPLLFESGFDKYCDYTICVYTQREICLERLLKRNNYTKDDAVKRIDAQMDINLKRKKADFVIDNSSDLSKSIKELDDILGWIRKCLF